MKITIDTKEDSHEEIKKVISMLSALVGEKVVVNEDFEPAAESSNAFASMFGSEDKSKEGVGNVVSDIGTAGSDEEIEEKPEIVPY